MTEMKLHELISAWLDGRITETESEQLQNRLRESREAREQFFALTSFDSSLRQLAGGDLDASLPELLPAGNLNVRHETFFSASNLIKLAAAATLLFIVGRQAYQIGKRDAGTDNVNVVAQQSSDTETTIAGYATLRRVAGIQWSDASASWREGDVLPAGIVEFEKGVAEIDFFCGATLIVEGPAKMELESDWSVRMLSGRLRANVPPAARGFVVKVADSEVVDLGTEFALDVTPSKAWVHVVDGEIELKGGQHDGQHLKTGQGQSLKGADVKEDSFSDLSTIGDVQRRRDSERLVQFNKWKASSNALRADKRLIAYYPIALQQSSRFVANAAASGVERDGKLIGPVEMGLGRFGAESSSFGFSRPGSRARVRIDGEFEQLTFACWTRIDSLEHKYNALFMGDGYENGEPHWQIRDDGRLMLSVMIDETPGSGRGKAPDARLHRIYRSAKPIWNVSMSGQWMHVASVYDPKTRFVRHFINGSEVSSEAIIDPFFTEKLRIGPAEIGNWGQPFRKSPGFAVRNFNGAIDELAIFDAALSAEEIRQLYEDGKSFGN